MRSAEIRFLETNIRTSAPSKLPRARLLPTRERCVPPCSPQVLGLRVWLRWEDHGKPPRPDGRKSTRLPSQIVLTKGLMEFKDTPIFTEHRTSDCRQPNTEDSTRRKTADRTCRVCQKERRAGWDAARGVAAAMLLKIREKNELRPMAWES